MAVRNNTAKLPAAELCTKREIFPGALKKEWEYLGDVGLGNYFRHLSYFKSKVCTTMMRIALRKLILTNPITAIIHTPNLHAMFLPTNGQFKVRTRARAYYDM